MIFTFDLSVPAGQYEFPFTIKLYKDMPTSCRTRLLNEDLFEIKYVLKAYFDYSDPVVWAQREV